MIYLLALFVGIPVIELYFLIKLGSFIGAFNTILIIFGTAILGAYLTKKEGLQVLKNIELCLANGEMPSYHIIEGFLILIAGFLLLTPGFITDTIGFLILFPATRFLFIKFMINYLNKKIEKGEVKIFLNF